MKKDRKILMPLVIVFLLLNGLFLAGRTLLAQWQIDNYVLIVANCILLVTALFTFGMHQKALQNKNPNVFVRSVMGSVMIKMAVVIVAIAVYRFTLPQQFSKVSVFAAMILYLIYLAVEVKVVLKLNKSSNV